MTQHMLTTVDNPWDPRTHYNEWYAWDNEAGYHTPGLLARVAITSDELSDTDQDIEIESAIDEICGEIGTGLYKKLPLSEESTT
jgi:hypothetical protein